MDRAQLWEFINDNAHFFQEGRWVATEPDWCPNEAPPAGEAQDALRQLNLLLDESEAALVRDGALRCPDSFDPGRKSEWNYYLHSWLGPGCWNLSGCREIESRVKQVEGDHWQCVAAPHGGGLVDLDRIAQTILIEGDGPARKALAVIGAWAAFSMSGPEAGSMRAEDLIPDRMLRLEQYLEACSENHSENGATST